MKKLATKSENILNCSAVFQPAKEGGFDVSFPDFPGCVTFGKTFEETRENAREVLELWLEEISGKGQKIHIYEARPIIDEIPVLIPKRAKISYESVAR